MSDLHGDDAKMELFNINNTNNENCNDDEAAFFIRVTGLPWNITKQEICHFLDGVDILNSEDGIHLIKLDTNGAKPQCKAYMELASYGDFRRAQTFHKKTFGTQDIEVFRSTFDEFQIIKQNSGDDRTHFIRILGLPRNVTGDEICQFFDGVHVVNGANGVHVVTLETNDTEPMCEAYMELGSYADLRLAQNFHKKTFGTRNIDVIESNFDEYQSIMNKQCVNESSHIIRIRGLPWDTTKEEVCAFFDGVNILRGGNGIHVVTLSSDSTKPLGEAYIELATYDDIQRAKSFHKKNLRTRYIEVFEANFDEFQSVMSKQRGAQDESVVRLRGLPWNASKTDIAEFFEGLVIKRDGIHILRNAQGRVSGEAFVHFETVADCVLSLQRNMKLLGHRYIEIFRATEQQLMSNILHKNPRAGGTNRNDQLNDNQRMHPYDRNGNGNGNGNNSHGKGKINSRGRGNLNSRGRNPNNRNNFRRDLSNNGGDMFMQNSSNNRNFNRMPNSRNGANNFPNVFFNNDRFNQNNQNSNDNFFEDFDLNELSRNLNNFDRPGSSQQNMGGNRKLLDFGNANSDFIGNLLQFNSRGNGGDLGNNSFGGYNGGGGANNRFNNNTNNRNFSGNNETRSGQHCIHMRGLPYYTDEMDVFNFFAPLKPSFCKIIINNKGQHSGEAKAYFDYYEQARTALCKDRMKIGNRYIELFYAGTH